jgi:hypothetical protein
MGIGAPYWPCLVSWSSIFLVPECGNRVSTLSQPLTVDSPVKTMAMMLRSGARLGGSTRTAAVQAFYSSGKTGVETP